MTGLVVLLVAGVLVIYASGSRQGRWAGFAMAALASLSIVSITVANTLELVTA